MRSKEQTRRHYIQQTAYLYKRKFKGVTWCVYCGDHADTQDHVFPVSVAANIDWVNMNPRVRKNLNPLLVMVPACEQCNKLAGAYVPSSILEKRQYIHKKLQQRIKKFPRWAEDEINELGKNLRGLVLKEIKERNHLEMRRWWPATARGAPIRG